MKVFVYTKEAPCRKIATLTDIVNVVYLGDKIEFITSSGLVMEFNTRKVKTTCYQN